MYDSGDVIPFYKTIKTQKGFLITKNLILTYRCAKDEIVCGEK